MLESSHPKLHQRLLGGADEPAESLSLREECEHHDPEPEPTEPEHEPRTEPPAQAVVEDLLDEHRDHYAAHGDRQREHDRQTEPPAELGAETQPATKDAPRPSQVLGDRELLGLLGVAGELVRDRDAHRSPRS
jgi:hypothetical protein